MGFYLRKSIKVGPLRFNLSKSGIGVSAGIKGLRFGTGPRGNYVHMGRHGVYYRATLPTRVASSRSTSTTASVPVSSPPPTLSSPPTPPSSPDTLTPIESGDIAGMVDASSADLLAEINGKQKRWRIAPWVFVAFVVLGVVLSDPSRTGTVAVILRGVFLAACVASTWMAHRYDVLSKTTVVFFNLENEAEQRYQTLHDAFGTLTKCGGRWKIEARGTTSDWKHQAGASHLVRRKSLSLGVQPPHWIKTNIAVPAIPLGRDTLWFFPDRVLVFSTTGVGAVSYDALKFDIAPQKFIESDPVPKDAQIVGQTWRYPNKSGGPDKRFKNNRQIPVVLYEQIALSSGSGLNAVLQVSRLGVGAPFRDAVAGLHAHPAAAG